MTTPIQDVIELLCNHLADRTAVLFLGAGVNGGTTNGAGDQFPLGNQLAIDISRDLLGDGQLNLPLDEASEIARYRVGENELNDYIFKRFDQYKPSATHLSLAQLPWDTIYTTNYDLLMEKAYAQGKANGTHTNTLKTIVDVKTSLKALDDCDVAYYKLHGSIDLANTDEGRLILTKEDYRFYDLHRKPLFKRLIHDLSTKTVVFIGYSFSDSNLRAILADCREVLGVASLPLSFAVRRGGSPIEQTFWREKHNIDVINADACDFALQLCEAWNAQSRSVVSFSEKVLKTYGNVDENTKFQNIGGVFSRLQTHECSGTNNAELFFRGAAPNWGTIRDGVAPQRDKYWPLMDLVFSDLSDPKMAPKAYLITGHAGTGKTTLIRQVAFSMAKDFEAIVLIHISGVLLDTRALRPLVNKSEPKRIIVLVHHAGEIVSEIERFIEDAKRECLPVTLLLEERKNQWAASSSTASPRFNVNEIELDKLSVAEVDSILLALEKHSCLGKLTSMPLEYRKQHFLSLADKDLLVALRELTTQTNFDDIIRDEYNKIPNPIAKQAYLFVAALGQADLGLRYETLFRILGIGYAELGRSIFTPTDGVLISGEVSGKSRHHVGFKLQTRHPIIASVIFSFACTCDEDKFNILNRVISELDPGYPEDRMLLELIVQRKTIVGTLADPELKRSIFDLLEKSLPNEAFVLQHRSILERDIGDHAMALSYAQKASRFDKRDSLAIKNTLGMAYEFSARQISDRFMKHKHLQEAERLFDEGIRRNRISPFDYLGKYNVMKQKLSELNDQKAMAVEQAKIVNFLQEALEATCESPVIVSAFAREQSLLGNNDTAIAILATQIERSPNDTRLRDSYVSMLVEKHLFEDALKVALEGIKLDQSSWRLHRHTAEILRALGGNASAIEGHYEAALRYRQGDLRVTVAFAAYLFQNGKYGRASELFSLANDYRLPVQHKRRYYANWSDNDGHPIVFNGRVQNIRGNSGEVMSIPQNFVAYYWRSIPELNNLRIGDSVRFTLRFNAFGPHAFIIFD